MSDEEENKVVLIGESGVGKTCIINQFINGKFEENLLSTLSAQFCRKNFEFPGDKRISLDIWDTAGQEKYRSLNRIFYKNAKAVVLVYDITDIKSFNEIKGYWYDQIIQNCDKHIIIVIAANKCDLYEEKEVYDEEAEEFAKSKDAFFVFTSAKNDSGIANLFENIAMKILDPNFDFTNTEQNAKEKYQNRKDIKNGTNKNKKDNSRNAVKLDGNIHKKKKKCC